MSKRCLGCMETYSKEYNICPHCGYVEGCGTEEAVHLVPGIVLHERYVIGKVIGYGGFGVTYLAWDKRLEQKVAIKEYLPGEFSTRMPGHTHVTVFNGEKREQFHDGLKNFVDEARRLAKFQNEPGIVKVFDSFEENMTAYIIMEYLQGETLTSYLDREGTVKEDIAVNMLTPVMQSLIKVHEAGILHRDIAPDNIFLTRQGEVKLIDFGASRYATTSHSRSLTVIIKPGYSPEEQYRSRGDQGPHTDVYSLAATLYRMITGVVPADAMERRASYEAKNKDMLVPPHKIKKGISTNRENAILNAMNIRIEDRTADVRSFLAELNATFAIVRRGTNIRKLDMYSWPLWLKILIPSVLAVILVVGILIGTGVIEVSLFSEKIKVSDDVVTVPDVEGINSDEAIKRLQETGLQVTTGGNIESKYVQAGKIVLQTPVGGTFLQKNGVVVLTVSSGYGVKEVVDNRATVPFILWGTEQEALQKLQQAGLTGRVISTQYDSAVAAGAVISQSIQAGTEVEPGSVVDIVISLGPQPTQTTRVASGYFPTTPTTVRPQRVPPSQTQPDDYNNYNDSYYDDGYNNNDSYYDDSYYEEPTTVEPTYIIDGGFDYGIEDEDFTASTDDYTYDADLDSGNPGGLLPKPSNPGGLETDPETTEDMTFEGNDEINTEPAFDEDWRPGMGNY